MSLGCNKEEPVAPHSVAAVPAPVLAPIDPAVVMPPDQKGPLSKAGIPEYPGSKLVSSEWAKPAKNGSKRFSAEYSTADSVDKVVGFYKEKLGLMSAQMPGTKLVQVIGKLKSGVFMQIYVSPNGDKTKLQFSVLIPGKG
jgi:hypothetical protein